MEKENEDSVNRNLRLQWEQQRNLFIKSPKFIIIKDTIKNIENKTLILNPNKINDTFYYKPLLESQISNYNILFLGDLPYRGMVITKIDSLYLATIEFSQILIDKDLSSAQVFYKIDCPGCGGWHGKIYFYKHTDIWMIKK